MMLSRASGVARLVLEVIEREENCPCYHQSRHEGGKSGRFAVDPGTGVELLSSRCLNSERGTEN